MDVSSKSAIKNLYAKKTLTRWSQSNKKEIAQNVKEIALHVNEAGKNTNSVDETINKIVSNFQDFQKFLESVGYDGKKSIVDLSKEEGERMLKKMFENADYKKLGIKV